MCDQSGHGCHCKERQLLIRTIKYVPLTYPGEKAVCCHLTTCERASEERLPLRVEGNKKLFLGVKG